MMVRDAAPSQPALAQRASHKSRETTADTSSTTVAYSESVGYYLSPKHIRLRLTLRRILRLENRVVDLHGQIMELRVRRCKK